MIKLIHHYDLDGIFSYYIALYFLKNTTNEIIKPLCIDHSDDKSAIFSDVGLEDTVYFLDFSIDVPGFEKLCNLCKKVIVIDHHDTMLSRIPSLSHIENIECNVAVEYSGCELAWKYFSKDELPIPKTVSLIGTYDIYRDYDSLEWNTNVLPFYEYMDTVVNNDNYLEKSASSGKLFDEVYAKKLISTALENGRFLIKYKKRKAYKDFKKYGYYISKFGLNFAVVNTTLEGSWPFDGVVDFDKCDALATYTFNGSVYCYSLKTVKNGVVLNHIAEGYGGGGHPKACGFTHKNQVFV